MSLLDFNKKLKKARHAMQLEQHAEALGLYSRLFKQYPNGGVWGEYGRAAIATGDFDLAERVWEDVLRIEPNTPELLSQLASEYQNIGRRSKARELLLEAAKTGPRNLDAQLSLATFLARTGGEEARAAINKCLELDARSEQARFLSARLDAHENKLDDAERQFRDMLTSGLRSQDLMYSSHYELAHILDRTGRFEEAMTQLEEAKKLARQTVNVEREFKSFRELHEKAGREAKALPKSTLHVWNALFSTGARTSVASLAFLGGPALGGASRLEEVLDAHPAVAACSESPAFSKTLAAIDITAPAIPAQRLNVLRERYLKIFAKQLGASGEGRVLLDKNAPLTIFLPAYLRAFPELRALIMLRDPRDVIVSLYFQTNSTFLALESLAQHYGWVMDVWLAVREWEGLAWMETRYEDALADLPKEGARVTKFLGKEWHEKQANCAGQKREKAAVTAGSAGHWRNYEKHLAPVLPALEPYCKKFGYA